MSFDVAAHLETRRLSRFNYLLIALSCLLTLFDGLDMTLMAFVAPYARTDLGVSDTELGALFSFGMAGMVVGGVIFGWLGDRFGRRPMILVCTIGFGLLTTVTATAISFEQFALFRLLNGIAIGGLLPLCWALHIENSPSRVRASVITSIMVGYGLGAALAGPLTTWIAPAHGWRMVFVTAGVASLVTAIPVALLMPESVRFLVMRRAPSHRITALLKRFDPGLSLTAGTSYHLGDEIGHGAAASRPSIGSLFDDSLRLLTPLLWIGYAASSIAVTFIASWNPTIFEEIGFSRGDAATASAVANASGALLGLILMRFTDRFGPVSLILLPSIAAPLLLVVGLASLSPANFMAVNLLAQSLIGGAHYGVLSIAGLFYPTHIRASGAAFAASVGKSASVAGPMLGAMLLANDIPAIRIFAILAIFPAIFATSALLIALLVRRRSEPRYGRTDQPITSSP